MTVSMEDPAERIRLIRDSATGVVPRDKGAQRARALRFRPPGFDRSLWTEMCALGWAGLRVAEDRGGSGLDVAALCTVAQELGAALSPEPFVACASAARLLHGEALAQALTGRQIIVPAWQEKPHSLDLCGETSFRSGRVNGTKRLVPFAEVAEAFVVSTRDGLALVQRNANGVAVKTQPTHDGASISEVAFSNSPAQALEGQLEPVFDEAALATAAYLLGAMETAFDMTLSFLAVRHQFGKAIGAFQAIQHRAVDLKIQLELTRAVVGEVAASLDAGAGADTRRAAVSRAKARAAESAMLIVREAVQFHGAMGMTDECDIGLYGRKILALHNEYGSAIAHRHRFAAIEHRLHA